MLSNNFEKILECDQWYKMLLEMQSTFIKNTFDFFAQEGILHVFLPVTTGAITSPMGLGSDSLPVEVDIFGIKQYMADSMQFHLEFLLRLNPNKGVHYLMPTFRGEETDERHLSQFFHSEAEIVGDLDDVINLVDRYIHHMSLCYLKIHREDIERAAGDTEHIEKLISYNAKIPRVKFDDALKILEKLSNKDQCIEYYTEHEFYLITNQGERELIEHFGGIVWLTNFPYKSVPFYQKRNKDFGYAENADLLMGIGETVGAGSRCQTLEEIAESMKEHNVDLNEYEWYLKMKEHSPLKTSGFGLGVERFLLWILKHQDIRDIQIIKRENGVILNP